MHERDDVVLKKLREEVQALHDNGVSPYGNDQNGDDFLAFFESQVTYGLAWRHHWFLRSRVARKLDDDASVRIKVMQCSWLSMSQPQLFRVYL